MGMSFERWLAVSVWVWHSKLISMPKILLLHKAQTPASGRLERAEQLHETHSRPPVPSFHFREGCLECLGSQGVIVSCKITVWGWEGFKIVSSIGQNVKEKLSFRGW